METLLQTTTKPFNETIEILSNVNEFYNSAWDKLLLFGTVAFAIIGILVPIVFQWYQKQVLKISEKEFETKINSRIDELKKEIKGEIEIEFDQKRKDLEISLKKHNNLFSARISHMQAIHYMKDNNHYDSLYEFCKSVEFYIDTDDYNNLIRSLKSILICLDKITKEDLIKLKKISNIDLKELMIDLNKKDKKDSLLDFTEEINIKVVSINSTAKH